jgi:hypothetical protein
MKRPVKLRWDSRFLVGLSVSYVFCVASSAGMRAQPRGVVPRGCRPESPGLEGDGEGRGGVPGRDRGCRHCQAHIRVSEAQVGCAQDGAPH